MPDITEVKVQTIDTVLVKTEPFDTVLVTTPADQGPPGSPGPTGPKGDKGDPGTGAATYIFSQATASSTWVINHGMGNLPSVTVVDSAGTVVIGTVQYDSTNQITLFFSAPFAGQAYLN